MSPTWLLIVAALSAFAPAALASVLGGTEAAWFYVCSGLESAFLWCFVGWTTAFLTARVIAAWGYFEAVQRPVCRLAFPMDHPVALAPGQGLCDAAFGLPMTWLGALAALFVAAFSQELKRG